MLDGSLRFRRHTSESLYGQHPRPQPLRATSPIAQPIRAVLVDLGI